MIWLYKFMSFTRLVIVFTTFAVVGWSGGWVGGELESNAKHSFQLLCQKNDGQLKNLGPKSFFLKIFTISIHVQVYMQACVRKKITLFTTSYCTYGCFWWSVSCQDPLLQYPLLYSIHCYCQLNYNKAGQLSARILMYAVYMCGSIPRGSVQQHWSIQPGQHYSHPLCEVPDDVTVILPPVPCQCAAHPLHLLHHGVGPSPECVHWQGAER